MIDVTNLAKAGFLRKYAAGEVICREGEPGAEMYVILQGRVEITGGGGEPAVLASGDIFGEKAFLDKLPRDATARAAEDSVLLVLTEDNCKDVISAEPALALRIMKKMSAEIRRLKQELRSRAGDGQANAMPDFNVVAAGVGSAEAGVAAGAVGPPAARSAGPESGSDNAGQVGKAAASAGIAARQAGSEGTGKAGKESRIEKTGGIGRAGSEAGISDNFLAEFLLPPVSGFQGTASGEGPPASVPPSAPEAAPADAGRILYSKKITCPVCQLTFSTAAFLAHKLKLVRQDAELRNHYANFEPLLYSVWICPHCYYAGLPESFDRLTPRQKAALQENAPARRRKFGELGKEGERARAIKGCLLILDNLAQINADPAQMARIWLRLAWLNDDAGDPDKAARARKNALELFERAYFASMKTLTPEQEQQIAYLIGELHSRLGNREEGLRFLRRAVMQKGGNPQFTRQVQDRIYELKSMPGRKK
ncbi:MAG: DUF2225 domain-containing protein [Bacillota bacterium]